MPRKIAMVGTAASRISAPLADRSWEIWGVSDRGRLARATRWYELHPIDFTFDKPEEAAHWRKYLAEFSKDVPELVMMFPEPALHHNVRTYPLERIKARFGTDHMASTFSWMMAEAIDELAPIDPDGTRHFAEPGSEISIYGVDMEFGTEYEEQRRGFKAMMTVAEQLGIKVNNVLGGGLLYDPVPYPMWQIDPLICKWDRRIKGSEAAMAHLNDGLHQTREAINKCEGALDELRVMQAAAKISEALGENEGGVKPYEVAERIKFHQEHLAHLKEASAKMSADYVGHSAANDEQRYIRKVLMG